jgi:hypothetical protein
VSESIECLECGAEIGADYDECPACGWSYGGDVPKVASEWPRRLVLWLAIAGLIIVTIIAVVIGSQ